MIIEKQELYDFLIQKNCQFLYHANSVGSAKTFIENRGLLSRGYVENNGLFQTSQKSDEADKEYGVWNDIFLDVTDLHGYFPRQNLYGPILFKYRIDVLLDSSIENIRITRDNPMYWYSGITTDKMYYLNLDEYKQEYDKNVINKKIQAKMITIFNSSKPLNISHLDKIIIDDPGVMTSSYVFGKIAVETIRNALISSNMPTNLMEIRRCKDHTGCYCHYNYLNKIGASELTKLFVENR